MYYVPFRPCVQGFAYRSSMLKHVSEGIDSGLGLPVRTTHTYIHNTCKHKRGHQKWVQFKLHCNDENKKWMNVKLLNLNFFF